jgi:hypothetical protein
MEKRSLSNIVLTGDEFAKTMKAHSDAYKQLIEKAR